MTSNAAAKKYATMGKSVSGGWVGLPAHPRIPRNFRPFSVMAGLIEKSLVIGASLLFGLLVPKSGDREPPAYAGRRTGPGRSVADPLAVGCRRPGPGTE